MAKFVRKGINPEKIQKNVKNKKPRPMKGQNQKNKNMKRCPATISKAP